MPNGRSRGRRRGRRPKRRSNEKGGRTVQTAAPALFAFMGSLSSSVGLSAWRWACAVPRCGSRCFRNGQRKAIIRTHRLSETGSDYIGLVRVTGLEPVCHTTHAPQTCLSASSSTPAYIPAEISELSGNPDNSVHFFLLSSCLSTTMLLYHRQANLSIAFFKKTQFFSNTFFAPAI